MSILDFLGDIEERAEQEIITVARESISTEIEKEYCVWVKPTQAGWDWLINNEGKFFIDVMMPYPAGKRRVRIHEDKTAVFTYKTAAEGGRKEENSPFGFLSGLTFYGDKNLAHLVRRIHMDAGELKERGAKHWDIDVFYNVAGHPYIQSEEDFASFIESVRNSTSFCSLVKVELEVERYELTSIRDYLPFEVEDIIPGNPKDPLDQEAIRNFWDNESRL